MPPGRLVDPLLPALTAGASVPLARYALSATAHLAWELLAARKRPVIVVVDGARTLELLYQDLHALGAGREDRLLYYPGWEALPDQQAGWNQDLEGDRLQTLQRCLHDRAAPFLIATDIHALLQKTLSPKALQQVTLILRQHEECAPEDLVKLLEQGGYEFVPEVENKGEAVQRGGLVDVWPPDQAYPVRLEFFGAALESLRTFDPGDQRSTGRLTELVIGPAREGHTRRNKPPTATVTDFFPEAADWLWYDLPAIEGHAEIYTRSLAEAGGLNFIQNFDTLRRQLARSEISVHLEMADRPEDENVPALSLAALEGVPGLPTNSTQVDLLEKQRRELVGSLLERARRGYRIQVYFSTRGSLDRFVESYLGDPPANFEVHLRPLSEGFHSEAEQLMVVAESDLYGTRKAARTKYDIHSKTRKGPAPEGRRLVDWTDIQPGELVVHVDHGIGRYLGLYEIEFQEAKQEVLSIEYAEKAKLYLPVSQAHLLSRYVGVGRSNPSLHRLGGKRWNREKEAAEVAVHDLAASLLETQAARQSLPGHAFAPDTPWQQAFEATFPYQETADQEEAISAVRRDLESTQPMDRLVCGDVGYGKTEVAMRAAFKVVMDGKQVAILVPTTILAQQHYQTFTERMASFPVSIEMLSRFRTKAQQQQIVQHLRRGGVDIVIGTHRLLQGDIGFKDLGLVVIDEEQRFGVAHKEKLKDLKQLVDVLTLSATPIPRTLYMSLTGAKDMSTIMTPPQERLPVHTVVSPFDESLIRKAVLREINREGQVFFLHNRVQTIRAMEKKLAALIPEARMRVAHGQMGERELEQVVQDFIDQKFDVLLCTTIIESGVDIRNVNTIIIDRSDRFGMSDLYQLRGRVGRYKHQAYACLLLPRHGRISGIARQRIRALQRYSALGAGFKLALRDLEIRGAGNLLGAEQSGHITAVGFDLYCQLLERTVKGMKGEKVPPVIEVTVNLDFLDLSTDGSGHESAAVIPVDYIEDENVRIEVYRKLAGLALLKDVETLKLELKDRFGRIPHSLLNLLKVSEIRIRAAGQRINSVEVRDGKLLMGREGDYLMRNNNFPRLNARKAGARLEEIITMIKGWPA